MHVCMYDCLRSESESASHSSPPQLKGVRVISTCARASVLTAVVHAHKVDKQKTDTSIHMSQAYKQQCFQRQKRKEISPHASTCTCAYMCPPQLNRISRVCECGVCVLLLFRYYFHPLCPSVCLYMYVRVS